MFIQTALAFVLPEVGDNEAKSQPSQPPKRGRKRRIESYKTTVIGNVAGQTAEQFGESLAISIKDLIYDEKLKIKK